MHDLKLQLEPGALPRASQVLAEYLPGLDIGLDALDAPWALLPASTAAALEIEYGEARRRAILHRAGVVTAVLVSDAESLADARGAHARGPGRGTRRASSRTAATTGPPSHVRGAADATGSRAGAQQIEHAAERRRELGSGRRDRKL